ncbi:MAG: DUF6751 family protein [Clostridium sp.]
MLTNADITIYNHKLNKDTHLDDWHKTVIRGVRFYVDNKVTITDSGLKSAYIYKIRIPENAGCDKKYVPGDEYQAIENVNGHWTIQNDDIVMYGTSLTEIDRPAELKESGKRYCKITSWSDNRYGGLQHWKIVGE